MGTVTKFVALMNMDRLPSKDEIPFIFTHIHINDEVKETRRGYRRLWHSSRAIYVNITSQ